MDLLAPCRSCLQCLPFFQVSPPSSSPQPSATATTGPSPTIAQEPNTPKASSTSDPAKSTQTSADVAQDLPISVTEEEPHLPSYSSIESQDNLVQDLAIAENESKPMSEIIIAPPVHSPPRKTDASTHDEEEEPMKTTKPLEQLPLHVPFINDISFSVSGLMPFPSPMTPAPFGAGFPAPAGQYHPSPHIYPPANDDSHDSNGHSQHGHDNSHVEHVSHEGHGPLHHGYDDVHQGHCSSHHGHALQDEIHAYNVPDVTHDASPVTLETSDSTPGNLDTEPKQGGNNGATGDTGGDSALIKTYHSEPIKLSGLPEEDDSYSRENRFGHSASHAGQRQRRRDHFKEQFKGISQQLKHGRHHLKEEGSKHLQTIISNMNKQAQQQVEHRSASK